MVISQVLQASDVISTILFVELMMAIRQRVCCLIFRAAADHANAISTRVP